jgi:hypothetical protein
MQMKKQKQKRKQKQKQKITKTIASYNTSELEGIAIEFIKVRVEAEMELT